MKGNWNSFWEMRAADQTWGSRSRITNKKWRRGGKTLGLNQFRNISWKSKEIWKRLQYTLIVFAAQCSLKEVVKWVKVTQSCPTLCNPMDCSLPVSSLHGILQARIREWVAIPFSRGSSQPRDWTRSPALQGLWHYRQILYSLSHQRSPKKGWWWYMNIWLFLLLLFNSKVMSESLQPHGLQHARLPCPSLSPRVCSKTHVHFVSDAIQTSDPLSSPSPPAFNLSQHQGLF